MEGHWNSEEWGVGGGGVVKACWNQSMCGGGPNPYLVGGVWIFSGTAQDLIMENENEIFNNLLTPKENQSESEF